MKPAHNTQRRDKELETLAVTNVHELAQELLATEQLVHPPTAIKATGLMKTPPSRNQACQCPTWEEMEEIYSELHELYLLEEQAALTLQELEYSRSLTQAAVNTLTRACLSGEQGDLDASGVRVRLLEIAVRPTAQWRRLAFTLFLDTSIASLATLLATQEVAQAQQLEMRLFTMLREMLSKAVVVATTSCSSQPTSQKANTSKYERRMTQWVELAVGCLEFFVKKPSGCYRYDRLIALDENTLLLLIAEASDRDALGSDLQQKVVELIVATMYASEIALTGKTTGPEWQQPTQENTAWSCGLRLATVEQFVSLELLICHFYNSPVARTQRLIWMVLFDLACDQLRRKGGLEYVTAAGLEQIWRACLGWEDASLCSRLPLLSPSVPTTRLAKQLASSCPLVSEKLLHAFLSQLRLFAQVDEYFGPSASLAKILKHDKNSSTSDLLMNQVTTQLHSKHMVERFRGERWLAELLAHDQNDDTFSSYSSQACTMSVTVHNQPEVPGLRPPAASAVNVALSGEELEETFCYDEGAEIHMAAQTKFWELVTAESSPWSRMSFARVLVLFIRRKMRPVVSMLGVSLGCGELVDASIVQDINTCLRVLLDRKESEPAVLVATMLLILDVCQREVSYTDWRWQQRDRDAISEPALASPSKSTPVVSSGRIAWSDSLASRVLNGEIALDKTLLQQFDSEFLLRVLSVLHECSEPHPPLECRRLCCGGDTSLSGDVSACTALILSQTLANNDAVFLKAGGVAALTPFLEACDTRVAIFMAKLVREKVKQADEGQYDAFLRDLYVACVEADDEGALYNSFLHAQTLLHNSTVSPSSSAVPTLKSST
ncbi:hypothetical protein BBJ28_00014772 [Nothophytophthora sp. Chile5]|nr:hypothetical protein BBJ28_00014772 [Nothophytophthora sp. Chile5]